MGKQLPILFWAALASAASLLHSQESSNGTFENSLGMKFRLVRAGKYLPGPPGMASEEAPWRTGNPSAGTAAKIKAPYYLGVHEVRVRHYHAFMTATGHQEPVGEVYVPKLQRWRGGFKPLSDETWGKPNLPVSCVSYESTLSFCQWLSEREGKVYRLPTEVEWEYAARAGSNKPFQWEDELYPTKLNGALANDGLVRANPWELSGDVEDGLEAADEEDGGEDLLNVGGGAPSDKPYPPNAWGFFHMLGNVQEFVTMTRQPPQVDVPFPCWTLLPGKTNRMLRGGSWLHDARDCTVYQANYNCPPYSNCTIGFRVVLEVGK